MKKAAIAALTVCLFVGSAVASELPTIAVLDFTSAKRTDLVLQIPSMLNNSLINSGLFDVVSRDRLNQILLEQSLSASGFVNPETAVALGNLTGAKYLLVGEIVDISSENRTFSGYGISTKSTIYRLKASVRILETESGRAVFSALKSAAQNEKATGSLSVSNSSIYSNLAEEVVQQITMDLQKSSTFKDVEPQKAFVLVTTKITSDPSDADVEVDGTYYGSASGSIEIPAGNHIVKISLPGYEEWKKKVMVREGMKIKARLVKKESQADTTIKIIEQKSK